MSAELVAVKPWPCEYECEAPQCHANVDYVLIFTGSEIGNLYLCRKHAEETETRYAGPPEDLVEQLRALDLPRLISEDNRGHSVKA